MFWRKDRAVDLQVAADRAHGVSRIAFIFCYPQTEVLQHFAWLCSRKSLSQRGVWEAL